MSTVAQVKAAAPSFRRALKPNPRARAQRNVGIDATMAWWCDMADVTNALAVIGGTVETTSIFGQVVTRIVPLRHPRMPWCIADTIDVVDYGWDDVLQSESASLITVNFKSPNYALDGEKPYVEVGGNISPRTVPAPAEAYQAGHRPSGEYGEPANGTDFSLTLHQLPVFDLGLWIANANSVNTDTFFGCPPGTLLFLGPSFNYSTQLGGQTSWRVGLGFKATDPDHPWNYGYLSDYSWGKILKPSGDPQLPEIPFTSLFAQ